MTPAPAPARQGFCPGLFHPMVSGDGLLVRIKPPAARLAAPAARAVASASRHHGNGLIDLTQRGNLQIRGLRPETIAPFAAIVLDQALAQSDPAVEGIRNVACNPLGAADPLAAFDSAAAALAIEAALAGAPGMGGLPAKFGILLDGGGLLPPRDSMADILFRAARDGGIFAGIAGSPLAIACEEAAIADRAVALAFAYLALAPGAGSKPARMRGLVERVGAQAIFAAAGLTPDCLMPPAPPAMAPPVGFLPYPESGIGVFGFGIPFGQITAETLARLADLAEQWGDATLRTTPWRTLLIPGVAQAAALALADAGRACGLITTETDPRLDLTACAGSAGCSRATVDARADAAALAARGLAQGRQIHVSGCAKGCAHPDPAALTLVGNGGQYDLVYAGRAQDRPAHVGLSLAAVARLLLAAEENAP
mgnify:FL=1